MKKCFSGELLRLKESGMFFMGSWLCLHLRTWFSSCIWQLGSIVQLQLWSVAVGSWLQICVLSPGSVAWGWICVCVSGIWRLCGCGFVSWVCVWGPCAALALGSDVWNLVSRVLCQSLVSSVWHSRLMVLLGLWEQFGIGAEVWGSTFGSGSAPGYRF